MDGEEAILKSIKLEIFSFQKQLLIDLKFTSEH